ncbi:SDR family NAD(P)-dependent oxidoreductase [Nocardia acidivorans]|uniref:SDR family NAD(P)-dependent oxidoreductase n=1 Tax=Nocardia acidivorans TaxID=404580 RepID=UPI0009FDBD92|nr:SDR family NAD(P)-dependent oxidoreductase [Nocardia acidivorans]
MAIWGRNAERLDAATEELRAHGNPVLAPSCDVSDEDAVRDAMQHIADEFGRLDSCFATAGVNGGNTSFLDTSLRQFRSVTATNLDGVFLTLREAARPPGQHRLPDPASRPCGSGCIPPIPAKRGPLPVEARLARLLGGISSRVATSFVLSRQSSCPSIGSPCARSREPWRPVLVSQARFVRVRGGIVRFPGLRSAPAEVCAGGEPVVAGD